MFPIVLDLTRIAILLVGKGPLVEKRRQQLREGGATNVTVWQFPSPLAGEGGTHSVTDGGAESSTQHATTPHPNLPPQGGKGHLPSLDNIARATVIMACGLSREESAHIVRQAHALGKLVNVEDVTDLCDFFFTANVRRGDLLIAVSTQGASPTLAKRVRDSIARLFGSEWDARTKEMAQLRLVAKNMGKTMQQVAYESEAYLAQKGWLQ